MGAAVATLIGNCVSAWLNLVWLSSRFGVTARSFHGLRRSDVALVRDVVDRLTRRNRGHDHP